MILSRLREVNLQINIRKCKFNVKETVFLKIIMLEQNLRMNLVKMKVIIN